MARATAITNELDFVANIGFSDLKQMCFGYRCAASCGKSLTNRMLEISLKIESFAEFRMRESLFFACVELFCGERHCPLGNGFPSGIPGKAAPRCCVEV